MSDKIQREMLNTLASLPKEILVKIMLFCSLDDCKALARVSSFLLKAYKVAPIMSARELFQRLYDGDLDTLFRSIITDDPDVVYALRDSVPLNWGNFFANQLNVKANFSGRYAMLHSIWESRHDIPPPQIFPNFILSLQSSLERGVFEGSVLHRAPLPLLDMMTPEFDDLKRLKVARLNHCNGAACDLIHRIFDHLDCHPDGYDIVKQMKDNFLHDRPFLFQLLFNCSYSMHRRDLYNLYLKNFCSTTVPDLSFILLNALMDGDLDLNLWFHQLVCWMFLCESSCAIKTLLSHPLVDPGRWNNLALLCVLAYGTCQNTLLLLRDTRVNPSSALSALIRKRADSHEMMKAVADNPNFYFNYEDFSLLHEAIEHFKLSFFQIICQHPRIDLGADNNKLLRHALDQEGCDLIQGAFRITEFLVQDKRVDPSEPDHELFLEAIQTSDLQLVNIFLKDHRICPSFSGNQPIKIAIQSGYADIVKAILEHPRFILGPAPNSQPENLIYYTLAFGKTKGDKSDIIEIFLNDERKSDILELFLNNENIDPSMNDNEALFCALCKVFPQSDCNLMTLLAYYESGMRDKENPTMALVVDLLLKDQRVTKNLYTPEYGWVYYRISSGRDDFLFY